MIKYTKIFNILCIAQVCCDEAYKTNYNVGREYSEFNQIKGVF